MELDKKNCLICKNKINSEKEYICKSCSDSALEKAKDSEFYEDIKKMDKTNYWYIAVLLIISLFHNKDK